MARSPKGFELVLAASAQRDLAEVMEWTIHEFGVRAALRYDELIKQALKDIAADPNRPGSREPYGLMIDDVRIYHLAFSRTRVTGTRVKRPRHFLLYRVRDHGVIEVFRILHDGRDITSIIST